MKPYGTATHTTATPRGTQHLSNTTPLRHVRNLTTDLRRAINCQAPTFLCHKSIYAHAMLHATDSHLQGYDVLQPAKYSDCQIRAVFKFRMGVIFNAKRALLYSGSSAVPSCPLCHHLDSGTHIMLACMHQDMRKLYIERHNKAVRIIAHALFKGKHASAFHVVDGGSLARLRTSQQVANRVPRFLTDTRGAVERRPDILQILGITWDQATSFCGGQRPIPPPPGRAMANTINLVEVGYGVDTRLREKAAEKQQQHASLQEDLVTRGWTVNVHPIALGVSGGLQTSLPQSLHALGVAGPAIPRAIHKLQRNAIKFCHALLVQRRTLEHKYGINLFSGGGYVGHGPPGARGGS